jgi:tripartite-type tricarboxylate transporter receptor subunit TctC
MKRRALLAAALLAPTARAETKWPARPIKLVVPFAPGGTTDLVARLIAPAMSEVLGQHVVVDNKAGASGTLGAASVAKARDDHTLCLGTVSTHALAPNLMRHPPYRPVIDFTAIALVATTPLAIFTHTAFAATLAELSDKARREPGHHNFGSPGSGSLGHLAGLWFNKLIGGELLHVPYRGSSPALQDLVAGRIQVLFDNIPTALAQVENGAVRALAVTAPARAGALAAVPTVGELGLPAFEILSWTMLLGPAALPGDIVARLNAAVASALSDTRVLKRLLEANVDPRGGQPADAARFLAAELAKWQPIATDSGVVLD